MAVGVADEVLEVVLEEEALEDDERVEAGKIER